MEIVGAFVAAKFLSVVIWWSSCVVWYAWFFSDKFYLYICVLMSVRVRCLCGKVSVCARVCLFMISGVYMCTRISV